MKIEKTSYDILVVYKEQQQFDDWLESVKTRCDSVITTKHTVTTNTRHSWCGEKVVEIENIYRMLQIVHEKSVHRIAGLHTHGVKWLDSPSTNDMNYIETRRRGQPRVTFVDE